MITQLLHGGDLSFLIAVDLVQRRTLRRVFLVMGPLNCVKQDVKDRFRSKLHSRSNGKDYACRVTETKWARLVAE